MQPRFRHLKPTGALLVVVSALAGCIAQAKPPVFQLSGRIGVEGTAQFQQPVLVDAQGKKWILDCTQGAAIALQGRQVVATVSIDGSVPASTLGVPRVCVKTINPQ